MKTKSGPEDKILDAVIQLLGSTGWSDLSFADIAVEAKMSVADIVRLYPSRLVLLAAVLRRADLVALEGPIESGPYRDRLFELLMRRFEALSVLKPLIKQALADLRRVKPSALDAALPGLLRLPAAMAWTLEAAGLPGQGLAALVRRKALGLVWLTALPSWIDDDGADLAKTMKAVDKALDRAAPFLRLPNAQPKAENISDTSVIAAS